jgi:hypothetical protein
MKQLIFILFSLLFLLTACPKKEKTVPIPGVATFSIKIDDKSIANSEYSAHSYKIDAGVPTFILQLMDNRKMTVFFHNYSSPGNYVFLPPSPSIEQLAEGYYVIVFQKANGDIVQLQSTGVIKVQSLTDSKVDITFNNCTGSNVKIEGTFKNQ